MMTASEIRQQFLDFFASKGHKLVPSAPIVVKDDPTLMFTNAGMNQFKDLFLGNKEAQATRVADTQKCLRVSGKHNDLEEVGRDTYHHTMFEMLGNWSFGDYFKTDSIAWAWELLTEVYKLPKDRLYVTVFEGDEQDGTSLDEEAISEWEKWVAPERILKFDRKDNFWEMGETGPCGPCSEIHIDLRTEEERATVSGASLVNKDDPRVIEIWNLVFMQYQRMADRHLEPLASTHVDTGMGLERLAAVIQGKSSNYDSDLFSGLIKWLEQRFGVPYGHSEETDVAIRVIVDHIRAIAFTIADGQLPSNTGAGYVIRRILRRAVRYAYRYLNSNSPFLHELIALLAKDFEAVFPELQGQAGFIAKVVEEEESAFLRTLSTGTKLFDRFVAQATDKKVPDEFAFELYDTFGFPIDLTMLMAEEVGFSVDEAGFRKELQKQKDRSRKDSAKSEGDWIMVHGEGESQFVGYDETKAQSRILKYREVQQKDKRLYQLVLDITPFYPEGGGQVGDTGCLLANEEKCYVVDTKKENDLIIHYTKSLPKSLEATFEAEVNVERRKSTERNHSVTHLVHAALRQVLGTHVAQKGSLVGPDYMRFDFSHFSKMTDTEIAEVEQLVNQKVRENIPLQEDRQIGIDEALEKGAMALFGEKYGDTVRMITFGAEYSRELCGGTHVQATGEIGLARIISESSVAAGVRRIEVLTGEAAEQRWYKESSILDGLKEKLNNSKDLLKSVDALLDENKRLQQQLQQLKSAQLTQLRDELLASAGDYRGAPLIISQISIDSANDGKELGFLILQKAPNAIVGLGAAIGEKANLWVMMGKERQAETGLDAKALIKGVSQHIKGGGGGQPFSASAGGKNPAGVSDALKGIQEAITAS